MVFIDVGEVVVLVMEAVVAMGVAVGQNVVSVVVIMPDVVSVQAFAKIWLYITPVTIVRMLLKVHK